MSSLALTLTESNISIANNTSDVTVSVTVKFTDGWWAISETGSSMSVTCNGTTKTLKFPAYNIGANGSKNLGSVKFTGIKHNSDGSKSVKASASWTVPYSGGYKVSGSASKTLTKIARASSIASISGNTLGSAVTVNITRLDSSFTHTVTYTLGSITRSYTNQGTSCTFTPPLSDATQFPNTVNTSASIKVQTFSGSNAIGIAVTKNFNMNLPESVKPTISPLAIRRIDNEVPESWGVYVRTISQAQITIEGQGIYGSTITAYNISGGGFSTSSTSLTSGRLNTAGTINFTANVKDSRGRSAQSVAAITVVDYSNPSVSVKAERCNSDGSLNADGTYALVTAEYTYASVNGNNAITEKKMEVASYSNTIFNSGKAVVIGGNLSVDSTYTVKVNVVDRLGRSASAQAIIPTGAVTLDFKAGGKGIAFGKVAEQDQLIDSIWPIRSSSYLQAENLTCGKSSYNKTNIELYGATPFIDFHYNSSNADYTSRIIESASGTLSLNNVEAYSGSIKASNWFRSRGSTGWYNEDYGGGIYMEDNTWVRVYNGKSFYCSNAIKAGGELSTSGNLNPMGTINGPALRCGYVNITPVANTPTSIHVSVSFSGQPRLSVTGHSTVIGSTLKGVGTANASTSGFDIYVYRTNTTSTGINWIAVVG